MKKISDIAVIAVFVLALAVGGLSGFFLKDKEFSENENRYLSQKPEFSLKNVFSGKFMRDTEKYMDDQFAGREQWITVKTDIQKLMGNKEINGVYLGRDGYLIEKWTDEMLDENLLNRNIDSLNAFAAHYGDKKISVLIAPTAGLVMQDKLPANAPAVDQDRALDRIQENLKGASFVDVRETLISHRDTAYYKTDHHWTSRGAFYAYAQWCAQDGRTAPLLSDYRIKRESDSFKGSLYSKVLNRDCAADRVEVFSREDVPPYSVSYNFGKISADSIFAFNFLEQKDQYQVFLGGNYPELTVTSEHKNGKHLLILKDSYANAFIPFLLGEYETVHAVDLRYFNQDLDSYIAQSSITEILVLYNIKNFSEDSTVSKMKPLI